MTIFSKIVGVGSYLPETILSNAELEHRVETSDEWIRTRTGIESRHVHGPKETTSDMAFHAAQKALAVARLSAQDIDLIIVATTTPDMVFPSTACLLQQKLGGTHGAAFDIQAVCTGFVYALSVADQFIKSGQATNVLVVGAETFTNLLDWQDRNTCVLFGDGAGAVVLTGSDTAGILSTHLHADGRHAAMLCVPGHVMNGETSGNPTVKMDGGAVFKFAVKVLAQVSQEALNAHNMSIEQIDWLIPHQANIRIIEATAEKLKLPMSKVIVTVQRHGNTSAASIPLALDEGIREGKIKPGDTCLLVGVGGGFTWGSALFKL
ncbi:3-oxoacyl-[acyl-carrier-protein] synthase 3 [Ferrovum sp. JA12]|uniref:beta-ketoacyl-ACP synthase III n=1 Tax=Ferrovum sp. JA12 TaxID=1356299 RepID=UPI000702CA19|nr:beta-ketoacyl-ACP synthase III [Ferrovum sp. JA12]KRH78695.1 3-oxoacyl-[acyl-carrier-protein] synthase 3 [Ferrovum sp. JA12]